MTKRKKGIFITAGIVAFLVVALWYIFPRLSRCYSYHKYFVSEPLAFATLSHKPSIIELPEPQSSNSFSLGPAQVCIDAELIRSIRYIEETESIVVECKNWSFVFLDLFNVFEAFDDISPHLRVEYKIAGKLIDTYDSEVRAAHSMPRKYSEIFLMRPDEFREYMAFCFLKSMVLFNQNGIGIFETEAVKGFVRFGGLEKPGRLLADVYSKESNICQTIVVISDSPERSKEALFLLLASYRFLIPEVPEEEKLRDLIVTALKKSDKFEVSQ